MLIKAENTAASLEVCCNGSVSLLVDIPFDFDKPQKGGRK